MREQKQATKQQLLHFSLFLSRLGFLKKTLLLPIYLPPLPKFLTTCFYFYSLRPSLSFFILFSLDFVRGSGVAVAAMVMVAVV